MARRLTKVSEEEIKTARSKQYCLQLVIYISMYIGGGGERVMGNSTLDNF